MRWVKAGRNVKRKENSSIGFFSKQVSLPGTSCTKCCLLKFHSTPRGAFIVTRYVLCVWLNVTTEKLRPISNLILKSCECVDHARNCGVHNAHIQQTDFWTELPVMRFLTFSSPVTSKPKHCCIVTDCVPCPQNIHIKKAPSSLWTCLRDEISLNGSTLFICYTPSFRILYVSIVALANSTVTSKTESLVILNRNINGFTYPFMFNSTSNFALVNFEYSFSLLRNLRFKTMATMGFIFIYLFKVSKHKEGSIHNNFHR